MDLGLTGKVAVVSGASRGIGFATAREFAREGCQVVLTSRGAADLDAATATLDREYPGQVDAIAADMTEVDQVVGVVEHARARFGPVTIVVSNVIGHVIDPDKEGSGPGAGTFRSIGREGYRDEFQRLLVSAWALGRAALPDMKAARWGRIMNVGSGVAREPSKTLPHVLPNTVRPAVAGLYRIWARELADDGITVNNILTGSILTERNRSYWEWLAKDRGQTVDEVTSGFRATIPAGRMGEPDEMAALMAFLASEVGGAVTGQSINVDGGLNQHL